MLTTWDKSLTRRHQIKQKISAAINSSLAAFPFNSKRKAKYYYDNFQMSRSEVKRVWSGKKTVIFQISTTLLAVSEMGDDMAMQL